MSVYTFHSVRNKDYAVKLRLRHKKTGRGAPGEKSAALDQYKKLTDSTVTWSRNPWKERGLLSLPKGVITPLFFRDFLHRVGASNDNPGSAGAILRSKFSKAEIEGMKGALHPFDNSYIALRSDECTAAGCGLWHTGFLGYNRKTFKQALEQIKQILASEFSPSTIAFKKRAGLPMGQTPGVLIQPMVLCDYSMPDDIFTTALHIIAITHFSGDRCLVNLGAGIGGANRLGARAMILDQLSEFDLTDKAMRFSVLNALVLLDGRIAPVSRYNESRIMETSISACITTTSDHIIPELNMALEKITKENPASMYLELAYWPPTFAVLQCAEINLGKVVAPNVPWEQKVFSLYSAIGRQFGSLVSGRKVVETENIVYLPEDLAQLKKWIKIVTELNQSLGDYILVSGVPYNLIHNRLTFAGYSNASAMVFAKSCNPIYSVATHFGGALREAGIPVIAGRVSETFLRDLKPGLNKRKVLVYANDEFQEGFMATMQ